MNYPTLSHYGIMLRFIIDAYTPLKPDLKHDFQFVGACPKTNKRSGLIANEYDDSIELPFLKEKYFGLKGLDDFLLKYFKVRKRNATSKLRESKVKVSEQQAKALNKHLKRLSSKAISDVIELKKASKDFISNFTDYNLEFKIEFYMHKKHRLFHPDSDNILYSYSNVVALDSIEVKNLNFIDTSRYTSFKHCFLFHDLIENKYVNIAELMQVDCVWIEYEFILQSEIKGWKL